jgi:hypothetical protein
VRTVPVQIKKRLRHWTIALSVDLVVTEAAKVLANLGVEALVPGGARFPGPGSAHPVASLIPIWKRITGRNGGTDLGGQRTGAHSPLLRVSSAISGQNLT